MKLSSAGRAGITPPSGAAGGGGAPAYRRGPEAGPRRGNVVPLHRDQTIRQEDYAFALSALIIQPEMRARGAASPRQQRPTQCPVAGGEHEGAPAAAGAIARQVRLRLPGLPVPVGQGEELLAAILTDPDRDQEAQLVLLQPGIHGAGVTR